MSKKRFSSAERMRIEERFDYADLIKNRLEDCGEATGDPILYPASVQALEGLIPEDGIDERYREDLKKCEVVTEGYQYTYWCGRKQGTPERPVLINDPEDWLRYDPSQPTTIKSPIKYEYKDVDWRARQYAAFNLFVRLGVAVRRTGSSG